jgi:hypothetical protein
MEVISLKAGDIRREGERAFYAYRGKGGKRGRRELARPAYEAMVATLADVGKTLETMRPAGISARTLTPSGLGSDRMNGSAPIRLTRLSPARMRKSRSGRAIGVSSASSCRSITGDSHSRSLQISTAG